MGWKCAHGWRKCNHSHSRSLPHDCPVSPGASKTACCPRPCPCPLPTQWCTQLMVGTLHRIQRRKLYKGNVLYFPPTQNKIFSLCHFCFGNYFREDLLNVFTQPRNQFCTLEKSVVAGDLLGSLKLKDHVPIIWMICISNNKINGKSCCWTVLLSFFTCIIHLRHTDMAGDDCVWVRAVCIWCWY